MFYTTKQDERAKRHWDGFGWGDRILTAFLLGAFLISFSSVGLASVIEFVFQKMLLEAFGYAQLPTLWFCSAIIMLWLLLCWRKACEGPIYGNATRWWWNASSRELRSSLFTVPFYVLFFLLVIILLSPIYGPISEVMLSIWVNLLASVLALLLFSCFPCFVCVFLIAGIPADWISPQVPKYRSIRITKVLSMLCFRRLLPIARRVILIALVGSLLVLADRSFHMFTSSFSHMELDSHENFLVVGTARRYDVLQPTKATYWIRIPRFPIFRNVTIPNPSNYSFTFVKERTDLGIRQVSAETRNATYEVLVTKGKLSAFNVIPNKQEMLPLVVIPLVLNFNDNITDSRIRMAVINETTRKTGASTERKEVTIQIINKEDKGAVFREILVDTIQRQRLEVFKYVDGKFSEKWVQNFPYVRLYFFHCDPGKVYTITFVIDYTTE